MEKGATLTLSMPCNNKKLPILLEASAIENGNGGVLHNGMSLFQDLKLKRRKVDSRCSSDGESIGTSDSASSLSPEAQIQNEGSPKDKDRCVTPEELVPPISVSKPTTAFTSQFLFMKLADSRKELVKSSSNHINNNSSDVSDHESNNHSTTTNGMIKITTSPPSPPCNGIKANASVVVVKTEPSDTPNGTGHVVLVENGKSSSSSTSSRSSSGGRASPISNGDINKERKPPGERNGDHSSPNGIMILNGEGGSCSDNESVGSGGSSSIRIKSEKHLMEVDDVKDDKITVGEDLIIDNSSNKMDEDTGTLSSSPRSVLSSASSSSSSRRSPPGTAGSICGSPSPPRSRGGNGGSSSSTLIITKQNMLGERENSKMERSNSQRSSPVQNNNNSSRGSSPPQGIYSSSQPSPVSMLSHHHHLPPHSVSLQQHNNSSAPISVFPSSNQLHARLTESRKDREQREQKEREERMSMAMGKDEHPHHHNHPHHHHSHHHQSSPPLSVVTSTSLSFHQGSSMYRINGVRPEVISGGAVTPGVNNANGNSSNPPIPANMSMGQQQQHHLQSQQQQHQQPPPPQHFQSSHHHLNHHNNHPLSNGTGSNSPPGSLYNSSNSSSNNLSAGGPRGPGSFINNGISTKISNPHYNSPSSYHPNHHPHHPDLITGQSLVVNSRKSPTQLSSLGSSRSPNSSPSNSSSSGSVSGSSQHSPGSVTISSNGTIVAGGSLGLVNSSTGPNSHHHVNLNRTPTVIMGEAGGVRTMLWSTPGQPLANSPGLDSIGGGSAGSGGMCTPGGGSSPGASSAGSGNGSIPSSVTNGHGNGVTNGYLNQNSPPTNNNNNNHVMQKGALSMELLWASEALNLSTGSGSSNTTNGSMPSIMGSNGPSNGHGPTDDDDYEQPMICMICEDRATGLHYGIITCEGCKGFFKRTVQNRRVYTCVADGTCEITKAQRNRCQYCRFKKCIEQGMVLQAVREDRMPGGRNSGAVYNLYKVPVKYRKHKKGNRGGGGGGGGGGKGDKSNNNNSNSNGSSNGGPGHTNLPNGNLSTTNGGSPPNGGNNPNGNSNGNGNSPNNNGNSHLTQLGGHPGLPMSLPSQNGNILKAALTSPNEVHNLRQILPVEQALNMTNSLVQCDNLHDIAALHNWEELLEARGDLSDKLCKMGDSIVYRLVQWTKRLPFYAELPVDVHTRILTHKWHELLVLTTSAWQAMHTPPPPTGMSYDEETLENLRVLQRCLQAMMGRSLTIEQLRQDVGQMVDRLTHLTRTFRKLQIRMEEYVSLKVISMLQNTGTNSNEVGQIQDRYIKVLRTFLEVNSPSQPNRLRDLLRCLPEVQAAASLLLESKMFYVPFLLNSALLQR